eukprot:CAMPEP_0170648516 /NCGR_PEP_ID=MMETSP0224-20130122/44778_1 /TAXON_ID=285029 /ORGANISM="Togula jolla, Strain CCCM 725" /LENGTH=683 /DNA_ID=CAMNT_0010980051 /DNA_START=44 /DNA_END=2093 /DNA_ORIENTATION=-
MAVSGEVDAPAARDPSGYIMNSLAEAKVRVPPRPRRPPPPPAEAPAATPALGMETFPPTNPAAADLAGSAPETHPAEPAPEGLLILEQRLLHEPASEAVRPGMCTPRRGPVPPPGAAVGPLVMLTPPASPAFCRATSDSAAHGPTPSLTAVLAAASSDLGGLTGGPKWSSEGTGAAVRAAAQPEPASQLEPASVSTASAPPSAFRATLPAELEAVEGSPPPLLTRANSTGAIMHEQGLGQDISGYPQRAVPQRDVGEAPPVEYRFVAGGQSPADQSLLPSSGKVANADQWFGWVVQTSDDGRLFFHHAASGTTQWQTPRELEPVLGTWIKVDYEGDEICADDVDAGAEDGSYWRNEVLGISAWKDPRYTSNVFQAALDGNLFFLQLYAEVGGFLDAVDAKGRTAMHYTCAAGSSQAVLYLVENCACTDIADHGGSTPLHWACRYGHSPIVRILLDAKANPDTQNSLGDTPMHEGATSGRVDALHWLVLIGANPMLRNLEAKTAAEVAGERNAQKVEAMLREHEDRWQGRRGRPPSLNFDDAGIQSSRSAAVGSAVRRAHSESSSGSEDDTKPSLALVLVRAARPVLRSIQWMANRFLGEPKTNLGANNKFLYDIHEGHWVLRKSSKASCPSDVDDSEASEEEDPFGIPPSGAGQRRTDCRGDQGGLRLTLMAWPVRRSCKKRS